MAKAHVETEESKVRVQPTVTRPRTVLQEFDDMANVETTNPQVRVRRKIESMDDLTPEERAQQMRFAEKLKALAGKIHLDIDLDELRGRNR